MYSHLEPLVGPITVIVCRSAQQGHFDVICSTAELRSRPDHVVLAICFAELGYILDGPKLRCSESGEELVVHSHHGDSTATLTKDMPLGAAMAKLLYVLYGQNQLHDNHGRARFGMRIAMRKQAVSGGARQEMGVQQQHLIRTRAGAEAFALSFDAVLRSVDLGASEADIPRPTDWCGSRPRTDEVGLLPVLNGLMDIEGVDLSADDALRLVLAVHAHKDLQELRTALDRASSSLGAPTRATKSSTRHKLQEATIVCLHQHFHIHHASTGG